MALEGEVDPEEVAASEGLPNEATLENSSEPTIDCSVNLIKDQNSLDISPLLKPACDEIKGQLRRLLQRLSDDYRGGKASLQASKRTRTELGDLLSRLQETRDRQEQTTTKLECDLEDVENLEHEASKELAMLQQEAENEAALTTLKRAKVEALQSELSKLTGQIKYSEGLNEQDTSELAATQRAAWCADERAQRQLLQNRQQDVIIQQLRTTVERIKELAASDRTAAELHSKEQHMKLAEVTAAEEKVAAVKKEAKRLHNRWENALINLRSTGGKLEDVVSKREEAEEKISIAKREAAKLRQDQSIESEDNWKRGHAVNQALLLTEQAKNVVNSAEGELAKTLEAERATAVETAEAVAKLQQHEAAKKEAERHIDELLVQKHRVSAAFNSLEMKFSSLLEAHCEADSNVKAAKQDLRAVKLAAVEKTAEIADYESDISKLQAAIQAKKDELESLDAELEEAERDLRAGLVHLEVLQQQIDEILKMIEQRTRELQLLNKRKQEVEEAGHDNDGLDSLQVEVHRLRKEISATDSGRRAAQANWSQAQERLLNRSQRYFQLTEALLTAENKLSETATGRENILKAIKVSKMEGQQLNKRLKALQREISRLDVGLVDMAKLETSVQNDLTSQQTKHAVKLKSLHNLCRNKENNIVTALKQHTKAATAATAVTIQLQDIKAQKKAKSNQIKKNRKLFKGEIKEATELQGHAANLRRKLSAVYKRRNTAAVLLQKVAVASGIDSSDRYAKIIKRKNSLKTIAEIEAAKQRLEALRLDKKNENLDASRLLRKDSSSGGSRDDNLGIIVT
jgi:chromosome segregation ATPase